jgi:hypothetical protein
MDNFSKFLAREVPTTGNDIYSTCLWTGVAVFAAVDRHNQALNMHIKHLPDGGVHPAMPKNLFTHSHRVVAGLKMILAVSREYYDKSLVLKYDVRSIPLKVNTKVFPRMAATVEHKRNTTAIVYPVKLIDQNIGSNQGLVTLLRQLMVEQGMHDGSCTHYEILNVDENIYWRTMKVSCIYLFSPFCFFSKSSMEDSETHLSESSIEDFNTMCVQVMYEKTNAGASLRKYTFCSLAWWHSYKWTTQQAVKVFSSDFLAPWFHHLWPNREFSVSKISHPARTTYLSYIRLAYPKFREQLKNALDRAGLNQRQVALLTNLRDLCEFFIPVVSVCCDDWLLDGWVDICVMDNR